MIAEPGLVACRRTVLLAILILLSATCGVASASQAANADRIVVTNVRLAGRDAAAQDVPVNLLIVDRKLAVVTRDDVVVQPDDVAVDASGGFLLGQLVLGAPPSFVILDLDPRGDFEVLLDTAAHVRFAIRDGAIIKNELPEAAPSPPGATPKRRSWGGYTPPPMAVPIRYYDSRKWNKFSTKPISGLFLGALMLDRQFWPSQDADSEAQVGDLSEFEGGEIRAFRFGSVGTLNFKRPWTYTVFAATNAFDKGFNSGASGDLKFIDYRLDIPLPASLTLSVGKLKEPISMERLAALPFLPWQERSSAADAFLPVRNHGVVISGTAGDRFTFAGGAFNNWIDSGESFSNTASQLVGRVTWAPAVSQDWSHLLHLGAGIRLSDAKQPVRASSEPEFDNAPPFVDTQRIAANDVMTYNLEVYWRNGPFLVGFEYLGSHVDSKESGELFFGGYHLSASWAITGEMRAYRRRSGIIDPLPVARPINQGGWGALEASARYSHSDLTDGPVDGGEMGILSLGMNWWLTRGVQASLNYRWISLDRFGSQGLSSGLNARLLLMLD